MNSAARLPYAMKIYTFFSYGVAYFASTLSFSSKTIRDLLGKFDILVVPGEFSGYILEVNEAESYLSFEDYILRSMQRQLEVNSVRKSVNVTSLAGTSLEMNYQADQLKAAGMINGKALNFGNWADGGVYKSPALVVKSGAMKLSSNGTGYSMRFTNGKIDYKEIKQHD